MATQQQKTEPEFDLSSWLGVASRPEREVVLYAANAVQAEIGALEAERQNIIDQAQEPTTGSWGDPGGDAQVDAHVDAIDKKLAAARKKLAGSGQTFRVRSADSDDLDAINAAHPMPKGADEATRDRVTNTRYMEQLALQVVYPRVFTVDELVALRKAVGEAEFLKLFRAAMDTMSEGAASSPFWRANSGVSRS